MHNMYKLYVVIYYILYFSVIYNVWLVESRNPKTADQHVPDTKWPHTKTKRKYSWINCPTEPDCEKKQDTHSQEHVVVPMWVPA